MVGWSVHQVLTACLRYGVLCQGKRVAVVGTGASAIQVRHSSPIPTSCRVTLSHICSHDALPSFNPPLHISRLHSTQLDDRILPWLTWQVIVEMSKLASQVVVFQRTPAWVIAKNNLDIKG